MCGTSIAISVVRSLTNRTLPLALTALLLFIACHDDSSNHHHPKQKENSQAPHQSNADFLSIKGRAAYTTIDTATIFCDEFVGLGNRTPEVVIAFRTLLKEKQADHAFKTLLKEATIAGQLYALCGLYYTDHTYFMQAIQPYRSSRQEVEIFMGCVIMRDTVANIVEQDDRETVRLDNESSTMKEWADKKLQPFP